MSTEMIEGGVKIVCTSVFHIDQTLHSVSKAKGCDRSHDDGGEEKLAEDPEFPQKG